VRVADVAFAGAVDFVADVLNHDLHEPAEEFVHLFTPQRLAKIDRAAAQIDAGHGVTREQVEADLAKIRAEWLDQNRR